MQSVWNLKRNQSRVFNAGKRFLVLTTGRRWAKTTTALLKLFTWAYKYPGLWGYFAPTYKQAKLIAWDILKEIVTKNYRAGNPNESELYIRLKNGSVIRLFGIDNSESLRGPKIAGGIGDEFDQWKGDTFERIIRPAISDSVGPFWFIGSPDSRSGKLREKYEEAVVREKESKEWGAFKFKSIEGGYIPEEEIKKARAELDEKTFREEYEASFEDLIGQVYYGFSLDDTVRDKDYLNSSVEYDVNRPLRINFDFNVDPFCVTFSHAIRRVDDFRNVYDDVHVFDELVVRNSNTPEVCDRIIERFKGHKTGLVVYGDAAGQARHTSSSFSDYQIIRDKLKDFPGFTSKFKLKNPSVKDRINAVNSKLKACDGSRHLFVHPRCKKLIKDFTSVVYKEGTTDISKENLELTHLTDGLGYQIDFEYPVVKGFVN